MMKNLIKYLSVLVAVALCSTCLTSCGGDDDDEPDSTEQNGSNGSSQGGSSSSVKVKTTGYYEYSLTEEVSHGGQSFMEWHSTKVQFSTSGTCKVNNTGLTYKYSNGSYRAKDINETRTCNYTIVGKQLTIRKMPIWWFGDINTSYDITFTIKDSNRLVSELDENFDWCNVSTTL